MHPGCPTQIENLEEVHPSGGIAPGSQMLTIGRFEGNWRVNCDSLETEDWHNGEQSPYI